MNFYRIFISNCFDRFVILQKNAKKVKLLLDDYIGISQTMIHAVRITHTHTLLIFKAIGNLNRYPLGVAEALELELKAKHNQSTQ